MVSGAHQRITPCWLFCDLDGTLLNRHEPLSGGNRKALEHLRSNGVRIVPATGRNWKTLHEALPADAPVDYAIFSTGVGAVDWLQHQTVFGFQLSAAQIRAGRALLDAAKVNYAVHFGWPDNHFFVYRAPVSEELCRSDFFGRVRHNADGRPWTAEFEPRSATQFLVILPESDEARAAEISAMFGSDFSVVRATSPADGKSIWLEIFAAQVDKAHAAAELTARFGAGETFAVGNDHNDLALLEWADHALVMPDAPEELKRRFPVVECEPAHLFDAVRKMPGWEGLFR